MKIPSMKKIGVIIAAIAAAGATINEVLKDDSPVEAAPVEVEQPVAPAPE